MQQYELEAWLGDNHGLNDEQVAELLTTADSIEARYPDPDNQPERDAALTVAYRLMVEPITDVVAEYGAKRAEARAAASAASAALRQAALALIPTDRMSEAGFADVAKVDRMSVRRRWLGKR